MSDPDGAWEYASKESPVSFSKDVAPGGREEALVLQGPGAIEKLTLAVSAGDRDLALRQTILHVICDGYPWGQVQSPVGDFFGAAPGVNPYASVPFTVAPDGTMTCRFVMPYADKVQIVFENLGEQPVTVKGEALPMPYHWNNDSSMHFRARWRINHGLTGSGAAPFDIPFLIANGAGVYVGSVSYLLNPNEVPSSGGNWWGEGDEKVFTDEDVRPSIFGTGSEDYYNYAWSAGDIFVYPYCAQPRNDGPANRGFVTNNRWHIVDDLPFRSRLSFYMELFPHETNQNMAYGRISYHYARPGLMDDSMPITREDVRRQVLPAGWMPAARGAAHDSTFFQAEDQVEGKPDFTQVEGNLWARGSYLQWRPQKEGDEIAFKIPAPSDGLYAVLAAFARDADSGKVSLWVNGSFVKLGGEFGTADLAMPYRTVLQCLGAGAVKLNKGDNDVALRYEGGPKNIGIDFLWIQPVRR
jgi:hypothetical protein